MISITPSHIIEYLFCPRFTYFEYVLAIPQFEGNNYKVIKGREIHDEKLESNKNYLRKKIGVKEKFLADYLTSGNLRGEVDETLILEDGTMAPLDYKFAEYKEVLFNTYKTQQVCYSLLIEENYKSVVNKAFIVFTRSANKLLEINIAKADKEKISALVNEICEIIDTNYFPPATPDKKKCAGCTFRNICVK